MTATSCNYSIDSFDGGRKRRQRRRNSGAFCDSRVVLTQICFALFAAVLLVSVGAETSTTAQRKLIVNGNPASPSDNQFFVRSWPDSVPQTNDILCGASLIHSDIIVTVAHCHGGFNYGAMTYDSESETFARYKTVDLQIAHPKFYQNLENINYDIMIIRLTTPITDVEPVVLNDDPDFPVNANYGDESSFLLEAIGVGLTETGFVSNGLDVGYFNAMSNDRCKKILGKVNVAITEDIMCADPSTDDSICSGDSGGPLTARLVKAPNQNSAVSRTPWSDLTTSVPVQVGVTSFGNNCEVDTIPDGFARISYFHKWINEQICKYSRDPPIACLDYFQSDDYLQYIASQDASAEIWPDKARITMKFQHDFLAEQTKFVFRNTNTNEIEYVGPHYVPRRGEFVVSNFYLPVPGKYAVEIHDAGDDGLNNPSYVNEDYPKGSWEISAEYSNGGRLEALASGDFDFESLQTKYIRLPRRLPNPDPPDTLSPTVTPFEAPSAAPNLESEIPSSSLPLAYSAWALTILSLLGGWAVLF